MLVTVIHPLVITMSLAIPWSQLNHVLYVPLRVKCIPEHQPQQHEQHRIDTIRAHTKSDGSKLKEIKGSWNENTRKITKKRCRGTSPSCRGTSPCCRGTCPHCMPANDTHQDGPLGQECMTRHSHLNFIPVYFFLLIQCHSNTLAQFSFLIVHRFPTCLIIHMYLKLSLTFEKTKLELREWVWPLKFMNGLSTLSANGKGDSHKTTSWHNLPATTNPPTLA